MAVAIRPAPMHKRIVSASEGPVEGEFFVGTKVGLLPFEDRKNVRTCIKDNDLASAETRRGMKEFIVHQQH